MIRNRSPRLLVNEPGNDAESSPSTCTLPPTETIESDSAAAWIDRSSIPSPASRRFPGPTCNCPSPLSFGRTVP